MTTEILDRIGKGDVYKIMCWLWNEYTHDALFDDELLLCIKYLMRSSKDGVFTAPQEPRPVYSYDEPQSSHAQSSKGLGDTAEDGVVEPGSCTVDLDATGAAGAGST